MKSRSFGLLLINVLFLFGCVHKVDSPIRPGIRISHTPNINRLDAKRTQNAGTMTAYARTPIATRRPTNTATITPASTPTATEIFGFSFPDWVSSSSTNVLLIPIWTDEEGYQNLALINSSTGERFDFPPLDFGGYFWTQDGKSIGLLSIDKAQITLIEVASGYVSQSTVMDASTQFISVPSKGNPPGAYVAYGEVKSGEFRLIHNWQQLSSGREYLLGWFSYDSTTVYDLDRGDLMEVTDPEDDIFDLDAAWSPVDPNLAIVHSDQIPGEFLYFHAPPNIEISIYNLDTMKVVDSVKKIMFPNWSPDGTKFLYQKIEPWYAENPPCIFDLVTRKEKCYDAVTRLHRTDNIEQLTFSSLQWSPNQKTISYVFTSGVPDPRESFGGLCFITLANDSIRCMLEEFDEPGKKVVFTRWSEDGMYIYFEIDMYSPYGHDLLDPKAGILNVATGKYIMIENALVGGLGTDRVLFRPMATD